MKYSTAAVERGVQQSREGCPIFLRDSRQKCVTRTQELHQQQQHCDRNNSEFGKNISNPNFRKEK